MDDINIALLIDSDNVSAKYIPSILSELSKYGKITVRRMYGDWSQDRLHSWLTRASRYSLTPVMQPNNTPGKNASDIGLIIDAMDILYTGDVQGFCIASSDGDFNKLATRLREAGKVVIGMGEKKTPESFRVSCERFIFLDVIDDSDDDAVSSGKKKKKNGRKKNEKADAKADKSASRKKKGGAAAAPAPAAVDTDTDDGEPGSRSGGGWTDAVTFQNTSYCLHFNKGVSGSHDLFTHYYTPCVAVDSNSLRSAYANLLVRYNRIDDFREKKINHLFQPFLPQTALYI